MGLVIWCAAVPVLLFIVRKYKEYQWGWCKVDKSFANKCFIVTGANSGIGKETVRGLVERKARVIMACRDLVKAKEVISEIRSTVKTGELIPMELDLGNLQSIKQFADEVIKDFPEIHVLINNAGVSVPTTLQERTSDGFEIHFGVNHLGHFYLTQLLSKKLLHSAPSRIVVVSSSLHERGEIDFNNLQGEHGYENKGARNKAYCNSKLANVYFCRELARQLPSDVQAFAVCPGFCYTNLMRHSSIRWYQYIFFAPIALLYLRTAKQGSQTVLHCALSDDVNGKSGEVFRDCKLYKSKLEFSEEIQTKLWKTSQDLINESFNKDIQ